MSENELQILKAARMIIATTSEKVEAAAKTGNPGANGVNNLDFAAAFINGAHDCLNRAIDIVENHLYPEYTIDDNDPDHPDNAGDREPFFPAPTNPRIAPRNPELSPVCSSCHHDLELNADMRCVRCGSAS